MVDIEVSGLPKQNLMCSRLAEPSTATPSFALHRTRGSATPIKLFPIPSGPVADHWRLLARSVRSIVCDKPVATGTSAAYFIDDITTMCSVQAGMPNDMD